jgi:hypothetical protein
MKEGFPCALHQEIRSTHPVWLAEFGMRRTSLVKPTCVTGVQSYFEISKPRPN